MRVIASSDVYTIVETRTELMLHHRSRKWNGGISKVMTAPHVVARTSSNNGGTSMGEGIPDRFVVYNGFLFGAPCVA